LNQKNYKNNGEHEKFTIGRSCANNAAVDTYNEDIQTDIELVQFMCIKNIVEQDYRAIKGIVRALMGFKSFRSACNIGRNRTNARAKERATG